jgi:hypothetical protein
MAPSLTAASVGPLPWALLPPSLRVDVLQIVAVGRPAIRSYVRNERARSDIQRWCDDVEWSVTSDGPWICISSCADLGRHILDVDGGESRHEFELGMLLGYPECCCRFASEVGESKLDMHCAERGQSSYVGEFRALDISKYTAGLSLLAHIPCTTRCVDSLALAKACLKTVNACCLRGEPYATWRAIPSAIGVGFR